MGLLGTFDTFTAARLGIYVAQMGLSVTGNNISNINTEGYTRQRTNQVTLKTGGADRYQSEYNLHVGNGVLVDSVTQLRDQYLDIRYRNEMSSVGAMDVKMDGLDQIANVLDEVGDGDNEGDGIIQAQLGDLFTMLENLNLYAGDEEFDAQVRSSASTLCTLFNSYASQLEDVRTNTETEMYQELDTINGYLSNIQELNVQIRKSEIHGDSALELRDDRNVLIDELSEYLKIDVTYEMEDIGDGQEVEKLVIRLGNANSDTGVKSDSAYLINGIYATQLSLAQTKADLVDENGKTIAGYDASGYDAAAADENVYAVVLSELTDTKGRSWSDVTDLSVIPQSAQAEAAKQGIAFTAVGNSVTIDNQDGTLTTYTIKSIADPADAKTKTICEQKITSQDYVLDDNDTYGKLQSYRELLTEAGEFTSTAMLNNVDEDAATKRGIVYYQRALDLLANQIATSFNDLNEGYRVDTEGNYLTAKGDYILDQTTGEKLNKYNTLTDAQLLYLQGYTVDADGYYVDENNVRIKDSDGNEFKTTDTLTDDRRAVLQDLQEKAVGDKLGGVLFSNSGQSDETEKINASNISIAKSWADGTTTVVTSYTETVAGYGIPTTASDNIDRFIALMDQKLDYYPSDIVDGVGTSSMFTGTFREMLTNISAVMANDQSATEIRLNNYYTASVELDTSRESVSGVDLNDEAMNLIQYQKAYVAACRLMTVVDEALDKLINGTGVVGL
jgi:flagellar hook-associated protein 1 FlgK